MDNHTHKYAVIYAHASSKKQMKEGGGIEFQARRAKLLEKPSK